MGGRRPQTRAPEGYVTIREASEILGITDQAVRNRIERGTLPTKEVPSQSSVRRIYLPRNVVEDHAAMLQDKCYAPNEVRIIIHDPERPQAVRVQTGRKGVSIHLGG